MPLTIGLIYDCKEDYLAAGFLPEDVLEFDPEETIAGLAAGLAELGTRSSAWAGASTLRGGWPPASAGIWSSPSRRAFTDDPAKPRCRHL